MPIQGAQIQYGPWYGGVDYSRPAETLPVNMLFAMQNCRIGNAGQIEKRNGFSKYIASALAGTPTLTACGDHRFSAASSSVFVVAGDTFYEDVSGTWTDRTGGQTITAADDNIFALANAAGTLCLSNGVDAPLKWTAAAGNIALLDVDSRFTWSKHLAYWDNRIWHGNTSAGTDRVYRSDSGDIETIGATSFHTVDQDIDGLAPFRNMLTIHQQDGIHGLFPTGNADVPYAQQRVADKGACAHRSIVVLPDGTMVYVRGDGVYEWSPSTSAPAKISHPLDGTRYWDTLNKSRLQFAHAVDYEQRNEVWIWLPYGVSQTTNNHVMVWNYRYRIWYGPYTVAGARNCSALIDNQPHAGGYSDGLLYKHDDGTNDNTAAIDAWFETAAPFAISAVDQVRWFYARTFFDPAGDQRVQVQQKAPGIPTRSDAFDLGGSFDAIETAFTIGVSAIAGEDLIRGETTDLYGYDPETQLRYTNSNADEPFTIRQVNLVHKPIGNIRKESPGVE